MSRTIMGTKLMSMNEIAKKHNLLKATVFPPDGTVHTGKDLEYTGNEKLIPEIVGFEDDIDNSIEYRWVYWWKDGKYRGQIITKEPVSSAEIKRDLIRQYGKLVRLAKMKEPAKKRKNPLTEKGKKILKAMQDQYGKEKGKKVFYASVNKGSITGVEKRNNPSPIKSKNKIKTRKQIGLPHKSNKELYLDWVNNFLTIDRMAEYYNVDKNDLNRLISHLYKTIR